MSIPKNLLFDFPVTPMKGFPKSQFYALCRYGQVLGSTQTNISEDYKWIIFLSAK